MEPSILIVDFGSQYTQLIARRIREARVFCRIVSCYKYEEADWQGVIGVVLSGGPASVYAEDAPRVPADVLHRGVPVLGICYGVQLMTLLLGGSVAPADAREFGLAELKLNDPSGPIQLGEGGTHNVWMSHGDQILNLPEGFEVLASTSTCPFAAIGHPSGRYLGIQFHPEVSHTPGGRTLLNHWLRQVCGAAPSWTMENYVQQAIEAVQRQVGDAHVVCGLSGGVDSTVVAALLGRALGERVTCIFVDNGLLRLNEGEQINDDFAQHAEVNFRLIDAKERFLLALAGVTDPERKRKVIGETFIRVFEEEARGIEGARFLAQGTLYPDVIESVSPHGPSAKIKSHHNVGGLPEHMDLELVEPLRELFKDEVRHLGLELGLPESRVWRHPFPGPGLAVRILGEVTFEACDILQLADAIILEEIDRAGLHRELWQAFGVLLPVKTVGVMGDERTYERVCVVRCVTSEDGMTADWYPMPYEVLGRISRRVINEVRGINRVVYDISSKPPATIEWE